MVGRPKGLQKSGGRKAGIPNKRTQAWNNFAEHCLNGGLERFQQEMAALEGKDYVAAFINILGYLKPKLASAQIQNIETTRIEINILPKDGTTNGTTNGNGEFLQESDQ